MCFSCCPKLFRLFLRTHSHCDLIWSFYFFIFLFFLFLFFVSTILCCWLVFSHDKLCLNCVVDWIFGLTLCPFSDTNLLLIFGVTICCALFLWSLLLWFCRWLLQRRRPPQRRVKKGWKWTIQSSGLPTILRDTLSSTWRHPSSKKDFWIWLIWRTFSFPVVFRTKVGITYCEICLGM